MSTTKKSRREHFTVAQVAEALRHGAGIHTVAAQVLGCAPNTIKNYVLRYKELAELELELRETHLDLAESKLLSAIKDGNMTAIIFFLKCQGKSRGYIERQESRVDIAGVAGAHPVVVYLPKEEPE